MSQTVEERARAMGWVPETEFRGDKSRWLDAEAYVKRGDEFLPFLRAANRHKDEEISALRTKVEEQGRLLRANQGALDELQKANTETTREAVEASRKDLIKKLVEAKTEGNVEQEIELQELLNETNEKLREAKSEVRRNGTADGLDVSDPSKGIAPRGATGEDFTQRTEWKEFVAREPWVREDPVMLAAANAIMINMIAKGEITSEMTPAQRFAKVAEATRKRFGLSSNERREEPSKVEGTRSSGEGSRGGSEGSGKSYDDLPSDAKTACDKQAKDARIVGKGKKYADATAYRKYYASMYFGE